MRWDDLFAELEAESRALEDADLLGEVADRTRAERGRVAFLDRLRASTGATIALRTAAGEVAGVLVRAGADFVLLDPGRGELLVPLAAVQSVVGLRPAATAAAVVGPVASRLGLRSALQRISRDRAPVDLVLTGGVTVHGTLQGIGLDYVDLAVHATGDLPRAGVARRLDAVPFSALCLVRRSRSP